MSAACLDEGSHFTGEVLGLAGDDVQPDVSRTIGGTGRVVAEKSECVGQVLQCRVPAV